MAQASHRFPTLDAMRGLAATSIVMLHLHTRARDNRIDVRHVALAVDFFFILSGFVLTLAYQRRLDGGWSTGAFLKVRLIRLYPLYALGLALGIAAVWRLSTVNPLPASVWRTRILFSILMVPAMPWMAGSWSTFMFNWPSWSLCMELVANVFHGIFLRRGTTAVMTLMTLSGVVMVWVLMHFGTMIVGMATDTVFYGIPRVLFSYCLGILLFHLWERKTLRPRVPTLVLGFVLLAALAVPYLGRAEVWYEAVALLVVFPLLVLAGACAELPERFVGTANFLGVTSYAVYILHEPLLIFWRPLMNRLGWQSARLDTAWGLPCVLMVFLVAWLADRFYDGPVRGFLQRKLVQERRTPRVAA